MAANDAFREELSKAWADHRNGRQAEAVEGFKGILAKDPNEIDGLYGLGLAQRARGEYGSAIEIFERCLSLVIKQLEQQPGDDHFEMLQRMLEQRLTEARARSS